MAVELRGYPFRNLGPSDGTGEWKFSQTVNCAKMREKGREEERKKDGSKGRRKGGRKNEERREE